MGRAKGWGETTHGRGSFIGPKFLQVKVLDEVWTKNAGGKEGDVSAGRKKQRVGDILPLRATDVVA
jgi:hypothetical protein